MDQQERVPAVMLLGIVTGALFATILGTKRYGWFYGLCCGVAAAVLLAAALLPFFLPLNGIRRLS
jgi:hypothetical protein